MKTEKHYKTGNTKIGDSCLISCLPTDICFGVGRQCKGCYAFKSEYRFTAVKPSRYRKLDQTKQDNFIALAIDEIIKSKKTKVRIHESGDFYSQAYIDKYVQIVKALPSVKFYTYTKKRSKLNFAELVKLDNFNLVNSVTKLGLNYGDDSYCKKLVKLGYNYCPCGRDKSIICMKDCNICLTEKKVCFLIH